MSSIGRIEAGRAGRARPAGSRASEVIPVIMCGGSGTRLWPLSRESMPKQFVQLLGSRSTFQETLLRVSHEGFGRPLVITNAIYRFTVAEQIRQLGIEADIVLEPSRQDSASAVAAAAALTASDGILLVLAADHAIVDVAAFRHACTEALAAARNGRIVSFGVVPNEPSSNYGYLKPGAPLEGKVRQLDAFLEKPAADRAAQLIDQGCLWNSGNFLFPADVMRKEVEKFQPQIWQAVKGAVDEAAKDLDFLRLGSSYTRSPRLSIDYAVMEKTDRGAVLAVNFGWSDLGTWDAVWANGHRDENGNFLLGPVEALDVRNSLVTSDPSVLTAVIGLNDLAVVSTPDAVLVAPLKAAGEVKVLLERLRAKGRSEVSEHRRVFRPWGYYECIDSGERHLVKRIVVKPGQRLSLQKHYHRSEHWVVVNGSAQVTIGDKTQILEENQSTYIPIGAVHRLANPGEAPLEIIEVQVGSLLSEDDIVRLDDVYNRVEST